MTVSKANQRKIPVPSWTVLFLILFIPSVLLVFWRCPYGLCNVDEGFYMTIPYRLLQGDALFQEEWHLSQMAGVLTVPFVSAYLKLCGSTEGMILAMRYTCTFVQCICAIFLYIRLKGIHPLGAILASVSFLLFTPFNVMALSYNSMGVLFLALSLVIVLTAQKKQPLQYSAAGLLFAAAVLCCPYLLFVYFAYLAVVAALMVLRMKKPELLADTPLTVKNALWITSGAAFAAVLFLGFVLTRGSVSGILQSMEPMFNDPEHPHTALIAKVESFVKCVIHVNKWSPVLYSILIVLGVVCLVIRKKPRYKLLTACAVMFVIVLLQYSVFCRNRFSNHLMWSANVFAFFIFLLTANPKMNRIFFTVWLPGMMYAFCMHMASNQAFYAISCGSAVATVGSLVMICIFAEELLRMEGRHPYRIAAVSLVCVFLASQLCTQAVIRYQKAFWESDVPKLTAQITQGVQKGIYTTEGRTESYNRRLENLNQLSEYKGKNVLYLSENTWYYLQNENRSAAYSAWLSGVNDATMDRLEIYYEINPHKLPEAVFADQAYEEYAVMFCERFSYVLQAIDGGFLLLPE